MALLPTVFAGRSLCMRCSKLLSVNPSRFYGMVYLPKYHHILNKDSAWLSRLPARTLLTETVSITDKAEFRIPEPEYDWDYLCDPQNRDAIQQNIINRKGVGNIDAVQRVWKQLTKDGSLDLRNLSQTKDADNQKLYAELLELASDIPNQTHPSSIMAWRRPGDKPLSEPMMPIGDEDQNQVIGTIGNKPVFVYPPRTLIQLGEELQGLRVHNVGVTSGPRSYYLMGDLARLEQALIHYAVDRLHSQGFKLTSVPDLLHPSVIEGCGFKTSGEHTQVYRLSASQYGDVCLSGTGEMSLAGFYMNKQLKLDQRQERVMTVSRCYRAEADEQKDLGLYRVHQFTKVEMFALVGNESWSESNDLLEEILRIQCEMFQELGLHCRILNMASQELGAPAYCKYDIEAWMPAREFWGEISSTSNCTDFQSRRLNMRYWSPSAGSFKHVHTLNGTACALPRMLMALVETHQIELGTVQIPAALQPYMGGQTEMVRPKVPLKMKYNRLTKLRKQK